MTLKNVMKYQFKNRRVGLKRGILILLVLLSLFLIYWGMEAFGLVDLVKDTQQFTVFIQQLGLAGIFLTIGLMAFAILFKMLPSAAVAITSGAVYGHTWGTLYIIIGAWLGAIIAFSITRYLGKGMLTQKLERHMPLIQESSQSWLMWGLFVSRLIPVIPYDIVSYLMGLTPLTLWRFSMATLLGLIPTSFFLAHFGGKLMTSDFNSLLSELLMASLILIGLVGIVALLYWWLNKRKRKIG